MTNCIKHKAVERIWLVPDAIDGELGYVWCDDPAPGAGMDPSEAVEYVRRDAHDARVAKFEQERDELTAHVDRLRSALNDQLTDCINFDDGQLTESIQENSARVLKQTPADSLARRDLPKQAACPEGWQCVPKKITTGHKYALMGEFSESITLKCPECEDLGGTDEDCDICGGDGEYEQDVPIEWSTIKRIHDAVVSISAAPKPEE